MKKPLTDVWGRVLLYCLIGGLCFSLLLFVYYCKKKNITGVIPFLLLRSNNSFEQCKTETAAIPHTSSISENTKIVGKNTEENGSFEENLINSLPEVISEEQIAELLLQASANQIWQTQDTYIRQYPKYGDIYANVLSGLQTKHTINNLSVKNIIELAIDYRNDFWNQGGNFSSDAYLNAYRARCLLELAYSRDPNNLDIGDELVETIQTTHPRWFFTEPDSLERTVNTETQELLLHIRSKQFAQIKCEVEAGRKPLWKDFERTADLVTVLQSERGDFNTVTKVVKWQLEQVDTGGWVNQENNIKAQLAHARRGEKYYYPIYWLKPDAFPKHYLYGRRLPSFKGYTPETRIFIPE